jgi:predicted small lipoprotein YifL
MLNLRQILVSAHRRAVRRVWLAGLVVVLAACGQKGALYLPTNPEAKGRATLPQTVRPTPSDNATTPPEPATPGAPR